MDVGKTIISLWYNEAPAVWKSCLLDYQYLTLDLPNGSDTSHREPPACLPSRPLGFTTDAPASGFPAHMWVWAMPPALAES